MVGGGGQRGGSEQQQTEMAMHQYHASGTYLCECRLRCFEELRMFQAGLVVHVSLDMSQDRSTPELMAKLRTPDTNILTFACIEK